MENKIPTTLEMDGIFTEEDAKNRFFVMKPCVDCLKYNKQDIRIKNKPCVFCGGDMGKSSTYWSSIRTYIPGKRKFTAADRKKIGA